VRVVREAWLCACPCLTGLLLGWAVSTKADTRILRQIRISPAYPIFSKIIKIRILRGYVSAAYRIRIRVRYVSDT